MPLGQLFNADAQARVVRELTELANTTGNVQFTKNDLYICRKDHLKI